MVSANIGIRHVLGLIVALGGALIATQQRNPPIGWLDWLKPLTPVATIGKTIRVYHVTE